MSQPARAGAWDWKPPSQAASRFLTKELCCPFLSSPKPIWNDDGNPVARERSCSSADFPDLTHEAVRCSFCGSDPQLDDLAHLFHSFLWNITITQVLGGCQWLTRRLVFGTFRFMDSDFIIRLTFGLYRVTELLSRDSVLRSKIEESAGRILVNLILLTKNQNPEEKNETIVRTLAELEMLLGYLQGVKRLRVINDKNFIVLEREYTKVRRFLDLERQWAPEQPVAPKQQPAQAPSLFNPRGLNSRQEKMVEILRYKERVQVWELKKLLPEVTKRTLRRDLDDLLKRNLVIREGEWNDVFYRINGGVAVEKVLGMVGQG